MPMYDYECRGCGHRENDVFQKFEDDALTVCPSCKESEFFRVIGPVNFSMKTRTLGTLAESNSRKMKSQINEEACKKEESITQAQRDAMSSKETRKKINKMTDKQKINYIMKGE